jgi:molybdate-binding protein
LKLANVFEVSVEELFRFDSGASETAETLELIPPHTPDTSYTSRTSHTSYEEARPGVPVRICKVNNRLMAVPFEPLFWLPPADAVLIETENRGGGTKARIFNRNEEKALGKRIMIAGCDPGISVLLRQLQKKGVDAVPVFRNSSQSLDLLKQSMVHIAGTHIRDEETGESNLPIVKRLFPEESVVVVSYAFWEEGIVVARGNPKGIEGIEDMARKGVRIVNREPGSGMRRKIDSHLKKHGISASDVKGYESVAPGHLQAAWQVKTGEADCCLATKTAACVLGLDFIPLDRERYDLVIRKQSMEHPGVKVLLDVLCRAAFRRELEGMGGYDARVAGNRLM